LADDAVGKPTPIHTVPWSGGPDYALTGFDVHCDDGIDEPVHAGAITPSGTRLPPDEPLIVDEVGGNRHGTLRLGGAKDLAEGVQECDSPESGIGHHEVSVSEGRDPRDLPVLAWTLTLPSKLTDECSMKIVDTEFGAGIGDDELVVVQPPNLSDPE
jgi:hypothetical protein